ncbi:polysaccharide deacetylase family protein [Siphonobacter sp. SORGH_AS_1065]|uniref:polysaccharide deacetylase family protein n=1 Tax=Siphonobacter sp. SORGH_AS_1065 TaxID=3041795 RepID=UPI0027882AD5|nr:polysaccharide deacetylase family protein [Siphonobacter sp. SORGH_AS_1065]MDQ1089489.1 putative glycoside hydrolase/deacetylase ChbG (UPF0249 family) [Siphonobacter sp. SORGH_AS_1065]
MKLIFTIFCLALTPVVSAQTYAEKLGFPKGKKVIIFHVDDAGMSYDSNEGTRKALSSGVATSTSVMMPCPWVPHFMNLAQQNPTWDLGVHLTLTSEWKDYRWQPITGKEKATGLYDPQGYFWRGVAEVVSHASPDEVESEMRAQIAQFRQFGLEPSHIDSHMGTLFQPKFIERYVKVGIEEKIPVMFPGGHNTLIQKESPIDVKATKMIGEKLWAARLPVLDDLFTETYRWKSPAGQPLTDQNLRAYKTQKFLALLQECKPGLTMIIVHCTDPTPQFSIISDSGPTRKGDLLAMLNPELRKYIEQNDIILTNWRDIKERRKQVK